MDGHAAPNGRGYTRMTLHPLIALGGVLVIIGLALAYIGASTRANVLQGTLDNLWPILQALGRAIDTVGGKTMPSGADPQ